jgi:uncharacterized protein (UPF0276 family)
LSDRFGLGWRPELAAGILSNLDRIDVVEVMADDYVGAPARELRALGTLAAQVPVVVHGVSLGLASTVPVETPRLEHFARVVNAVEPPFWSEHLAFVRGGGLEIGHLAAPPRNDATLEGTLRNVERARRVVGTEPLLENIATLIEPPGSRYDEVGWVTELLRRSSTGLLLDLHNLHANALNFHYDALDFLARLPLDRVTAIHLAGGKWIADSQGERRLLDDHLHDVPDAVYHLLTEVAARAPTPLTVILERDGEYPLFTALLDQLERARAAVVRGRLRAVEPRWA